MKKQFFLVLSMTLSISLFSLSSGAQLTVSQAQNSIVFNFDAHQLGQPLGCIYIQGEFFTRLNPEAIQKGEFRKEWSRFTKLHKNLGNPEKLNIRLFIDGYSSSRAQYLQYEGQYSLSKTDSRSNFAYGKTLETNPVLEQFVATRIRELRELRQRIKERGQQFTVDLTPIFMLTDDEKERMSQPLPVPEINDEDKKGILYPDNPLPPPSELDWCNKDGKNWVTPVKDQESCGACWAFAALAQLEATFNILENDPDLDLDLSEQTPVSGCSDAGDCTNGDPNKALEFIMEKGVPTEECDPYTAQNESCTQCTDWKSEARTVLEVSTVTDFGEYKDYDKIIGVLQHHPVLSFIATTADGFHAYSGGIFSYEGEEAFLSDHVVCIVGWSEEEDYWKFKNSWGEDWGDNGFMLIKRGQGHRLGELINDALIKALVVDAGPENVVLDNGQAQLNGVIKDGSPNLAETPPNDYTWQWSPAKGLSDASIKNPVASPTENTMYYFTGSDINVSRTDSILVLTHPTSTKPLPESINRAKLTMKPGIFSQSPYTFVYNLSKETNIKLRVVNVSGRLIQEKEYGTKIGYGTLSFDMNPLPQGIYFFTVRGDGETFQAKIIWTK